MKYFHLLFFIVFPQLVWAQTIDDYRNPSLLKQAEDRIEEIRKTDIRILVSGSEVKVQPVEIKMLSHDFYFGSAISAGPFISNEKYRQHFLENFNYATISNSLKWPHFINPDRKENALQAADILLEKGIPLRGHTLVWNFPEPFQDLPPQEQYRLLISFVKDAAGNSTLQKAILDWDVQNEASHHSNIFKTFGRDSLVKIFNLVHQLDPDARLIVNDAKILSQADKIYVNGHRAFHYNLIRDLIDAGAPVHGIGFQGHHSNAHLVPMDTIWNILQQFSHFNLPMQITEMDIKVAGGSEAKTETPAQEQLEADYLEDFITLCFSHPLMDAIVMWGFWDGLHWKKNAPLYYENWTLKPSGKMYQNLVFNKWWTTENGQTSSKGVLETRVFKGRYRIKVGDSEIEHHVDQPVTIEFKNNNLVVHQ